MAIDNQPDNSHNDILPGNIAFSYHNKVYQFKFLMTVLFHFLRPSIGVFVLKLTCWGPLAGTTFDSYLV